MSPDYVAVEYEFEVVEHLVTSQSFIVRAKTRKEAVEKVKAGDFDFVVGGDLWPSRPIRVRDAKRLRRVTSPEQKGSDDA